METTTDIEYHTMSTRDVSYLEIGTTINSLFTRQSNETKIMKAQLVAYDILIPFLGVLIILTNAAVVVSSGLLLKKGQQPRCTYLLLGNVAMADLVTGVAVLLGQLYPKSNRTHNICALQLGMIVSSTLASIYSVMLIALDRFLYILHGLKYRHWVYPTRARGTIFATWVLGLIVGFLPLMGWAGDTDNGRICWFIVIAPRSLVVFTTIVGLIPVLVVIILYSIILYNAIKKVIQLNKIGKDDEERGNQNSLRMFRGGTATSQGTTNHTLKTISEKNETLKRRADETNEPITANRETRIGKIINRLGFNKEPPQVSENVGQENKNPPSTSKWKAIKVVFFTTGSFVCTWVPYFIACTMFVFCDYQLTPGRCQRLKFAIASPLAILGFINSLLNPMIYAWWHNGFRKSIKKLCCRRITQSMPVAGSAHDSRGTSSQTFNKNSSTE